jgi:4a-hydroxytetrahydrobiopterin dehydratase
MNLAEKKCVPCEGGTSAMEEGQACTLLRSVPGWELENQSLVRTFKFKDFLGSMAFVNEVADVAETEGHHPDIHISWNRVTLTLTTHAIGGLSENDFILAAKINRLAA